MAGTKSTALKGGLNLVKGLLAPRDELTAAQRAEAGRMAADLIKSQQQVKASEALGQLREKGLTRTSTTQADRTRVGGGNIGGAPFSAISEAHPAYAGKVWGVMDAGTASRLANLTSPETAWTTMLGSAEQLKTNPIVFDKLKRGFVSAMKEGKLSPELEAKINRNLALTFGEGAEIRDPKIWKQADTFEKRAALADLMMGQGVAPKKGGVALGGEKSGKGVIFKPTEILKRETESSLLHPEHGGAAPTFAAGPRLFKLEKESEYRPDLHPGFPTLIGGKDLGYNVIPTPTEVYLPDWHAKFKAANPERKPGYYDLALGVKGEGLPTQQLTDEYIRHLMREGYKDGGAVDVDAADARLEAAIGNRMAKGGDVDLDAADARLNAAVTRHMASGGAIKGVAKAVNKLFSSAPQADALKLAQERAALPVSKGGLGLPKDNTPEQRAKAMGFDRDTYHGSMRDIKKLDPKAGSTESHAGKGVYSTDSAKDASRNYASIYGPDVSAKVERGMELRDKDWRKIHSRMKDNTLTPRQQEIILKNTVGADNLGVVYPLKIRSDKSIHLDKPENNPVMVGPFQHYDEATDVWSDAPATPKFNEALDEFRELGGDANPIYDIAQDYNEAMPASKLFMAIKKEGDSSGLYDPDTGDIVSGGVAAGDFMKHFGIDEIRHTPRFMSDELNIGKEHTISMNPDNVRSRFAAFDPFRRSAATAATMGVAAPDLLAKEVKEKKKAHGGLAMADGGVAHMAAGGLKAASRIGKRIFRSADEGTPVTRGSPRKFGEETGGLSIVKEPGGNWLTGSVEKSLENLKRLDRATGGRQNPKESMAEMKATYTPEALKTMTPETRRFVDAAFKDLEKKIALNDWVDRNLTNYVKKQMATKDDPVRKLAEEGVIHVPSSEIGEGLYHAPRNRAELGQPQLGQSAAAKAWEDATDTAINVRDIAGLHKSFKEPWMENAPAGTKVSNVVLRNLDNLGFDHIMDVLRADVRAGRIRPEQLNKISMEQAVRRVHEHDQELARKMAEAQIKATEGMPVHKDYADKGYKWIELTKPKNLPEGMSEEAANKALADALKYEGETMGHCVGSYCDDVSSGKSRIYSLRSAKGEPHVTVEVRPQKANDPSKGLSQNAQVPQNLMDEYEKAFRESGAHSMNYSTNFWPWLQQSNPEEFARLTAELPPKIVQIKGKQNLAPKEEYLPFVQDFVRSGKWSEVGDLRNTGLVPIDEASDLAAALKSAGKDVPPYVSQSELTNLLKWNRNEGDLPSGFANGGGAFKTLQWKNPQNFNGGGAANAGKPSIGQRLREYEPLLTDTRLSDIKKNAAELWKEGKGQLEEEYKQLGRKGGPKDFAIRVGSQLLGTVPDILNLGLEGIDLAAAYTPGLGRPESVMDVEGSRVPIVSLASEKPLLGSQQFIDKAKEAKLLGKKEFPISELAANIFGPIAAVSALKKGKKAYTSAKNLSENKRRGGLAATSQ